MPKKILIAEDEKPYANALFFKLQHEGYEVQIAEDGEVALALLKKNQFDLLLLDIIMPKLNGFELLEGLKKANIKIKVLVLSNLDQVEDMQKAKNLGATEFVAKANTSILDVINKVKQSLQT